MATMDRLADFVDRITRNIGRVIVGNREGIDSYLIQMFCNFHIAMPVCIAFDGSH